MSPDPGAPGAAPLEPPSTEVTALPDRIAPTGEDQRAGGDWGPGLGWQGLDLATIIHLVSLVGAFVFWAWFDRRLWFFGDEWDFLMVRGLAHAPANHSSIWFPHNEHWSTLPILLWRALFNVFHLSSYWPYLVPLLLAQVAVMHLVWRLCRRGGADPWVSVAAVVLVGLLGAGAEDLAWAFQIGFVGSVLFGLLAMDLLDRPAASSHLVHSAAAAALLAGLMCSTLGDAMVVGATVVALARLPVRRAALVIGPPVAIYLLWFAVVGHLGLAEHSDRFPLATFTGIPSYVWTGLSSALGQAFNLPAAGAAILVGLGAWTVWQLRALWSGHPGLVAVGAAVIAFYILAALGRDASTMSPTVSRYIYVAVVLMVPLVAKVLSSLGARPAGRLGAVGLLAFSTLGNVGQAQIWTTARVALTSEVKTQLAATGELLASGARDVAGPQAAPVSFSPNLSVADIARLGRSRWLPNVPVSPVDLVNARTVLAVGVWNGLNMTLTRSPLFGGQFRFVKSALADIGPQQHGCRAFTPQAANQNIQIWLQVQPGTASASVRLSAVPAPAGTVDYAAVVLAPPALPSATVPVELAVPTDGTGYLSDNYAPGNVVIFWNEGTVLTLCGLAPGS